MAKNTTKTKEEYMEYLQSTDEGRRKLKAVKNNILSEGNSEGFQDIFSIIPKTIIKVILKKHLYGFDKDLADPTRFSLKDLDFLAQLFEVERDEFIHFIRKSIPTTASDSTPTPTPTSESASDSTQKAVPSKKPVRKK